MAAKSARDVWEAALGQLQVQVTRVNYDTWLRDTTGVSWENDTFTIAAPTAFASDWLEKRMATMIRRTLHQVLGQPVDVRFVIEQKGGAVNGSSTASALSAPVVEPERVARGSRLSPRYTFETFIVGSSNRLPHAAAISVAENPGHSYNPLFIYGGVGLGKTHLLHAIGHVAQRRGLHVLYVSSEQFTNEFINAIRDHRNEDFRQKYRSVDVLLIDDIQFIAGKEQTQEEFFHTFNDLHSTGRQLVISSDRPPKSMPTLEDRLRSRFEWGLIADIQLPDYETRMAILRTKAQETGEPLPPEVSEFIAQKVQSNIRELEGALNRVLAYARLNEMPLTMDVAAEVLTDMTASSGRRRSVRPDEIIRAVADFYRLDVTDLEGKRRDKDTALARQVAMYLLREETPLSLSEIGSHLGGRDHTTVMHGHQKISGEINVQATLRREVNQLREGLYTRREAVA